MWRRALHEFGSILKQSRASAGDRRHGSAGAAGWRLRLLRLLPRSRSTAGTTGTDIRSCTRPPRASVRSMSALFLGFGGRNAAQMASAWNARRAVSARRRRDRHRTRGFRRLYRHVTATAARTAPTSSCRARPIRRSPASTSIWRGACRCPPVPRSRRERRARIGRFCARYRTCSASSLPYDSVAALRRGLFEAHPHLQRIDRITPGERTDIVALASRRDGTPEKRAVLGAAIDDFYFTNPIARASAVMAECSLIAEGSAALSAAE